MSPHAVEQRTPEPHTTAPQSPASQSPTSPSVGRHRRRKAPVRILAGLLVLLVLLAAAAASWWLFVTTQARAGIESWIAARRQAGITVDYDSLTTGGFPLEAVLRIERPSALRSTAAAALAWRGSALTLRAPVWAPDRIRFTLDGSHEVEVVGAPPDPGLRLRTGHVGGTIAPDDSGDGEAGGARRRILDAEASDLELFRGPPAAAIPLAFVPAARLRLREAAGPDRPVEVELDLSRLMLGAGRNSGGVAAGEAGPFGPLIEQLTLSFATAALPADLSAAALSAWRDAGGRLDIRWLALRWGPIAAEARGVVGLDERLRPAGSLTLRITGYEAAIDALARSGRIPPENAPALKLFGRLLSLRSAGDAVELPVRVENGWLHAGSIRLVPVPPLPVR